MGPLGTGSLALLPLNRLELKGGPHRPEKGEFGGGENTGQGLWRVREEAMSYVSILDNERQNLCS